jgi:methylase of polypeptide subunit release factors
LPSPTGKSAATHNAARLGDALRDRGYTDDAITEALGLRSIGSLRYADFPVYERKLTEEPLATLVRAFLLNRPVEREQIEALLGESATPFLDSAIAVTPFDGLLIASDPRPETRPDHVGALTRSTETAAALTVRQPVDIALDIGTGSGVLALLAAKHSGRVVGTDVNPRALEFCRLSAALSGIKTAEWREGSLFEPVGGARFGCICCNAPYVVSPEVRFVFRESGRAEDFCAELVRESAAALEDGGYATLNVSWTLDSGQAVDEPVRAWLGNLGCDAWLVVSEVDDPLTHSAVWNRPLDASDPPTFAATLDRWLRYFEREGVDAIATGTLYLRRRPGGRNWFRSDELPSGPFGPATEHVLRVFANQDVLEARGEDAVTSLPLRFDVPHSLRRAERAGDGWTVDRARLYLREGLRFRIDVDERTLALLPRLDGTKSGEGHDPAPLRRLLELGFLTFAEE